MTTTAGTGVSAKPEVPLVVDLDGTLLRTDLFHEELLALLRTRPQLIGRLPSWLLGGSKASVERKVAESVSLGVDHLPLNSELVEWLDAERDAGRRVVLATGSGSALANRIAERVGVFDEVLASEGVASRSGSRKAATLVERYGEQGFDYVGNARSDLEVRRHARRAITVGAVRGAHRRAAAGVEVAETFPSQPRGFHTWYQVLRMHQWTKNLLLLLPLFAAHTFPTGETAVNVVLALAAMSLCASAVYVTNDLVDLESDRRHERKRRRPFASGHMPLRFGFVLAPSLLGLGLLLAFMVNQTFLGWILVYVVATTAYTFGLKRVAILDCILLALLYTLRVVAGAAATDISLSFWLLALCVFLFLSLAFLKRVAELEGLHSEGVDVGGRKVHGRGYQVGDGPVLQSLGVASGFAASLVLALYIDSDGVRDLYSSPVLLWGSVPVLVYWISWLWLEAQRGQMHDDPLLFAIRDRTSLVLGGVFAGVFVVAALVQP